MDGQAFINMDHGSIHHISIPKRNYRKRKTIFNWKTEQCLPLQTISSMSSDLISVGVSSISTICRRFIAIDALKYCRIVTPTRVFTKEISQNSFIDYIFRFRLRYRIFVAMRYDSYFELSNVSLYCFRHCVTCWFLQSLMFYQYKCDSVTL